MKKTKTILLALILATLNAFTAYAGGDIALPGFETKLLELGIGLYDEDSYINLVKYLQTGIETAEEEIEKTKKTLENNQIDEETKEAYKKYIKDCKFLKKFYKHGGQLLEQTQKSALQSAERINNFNTAKRIVYSVLSEFAPFPSTGNIFAFLGKTIDRVDLTLPYVNESDRGALIGVIQGSQEATNLISVSEPDHFLTPEELSQMTTNEIAD